jgi:tRNA (guanine37-N1)-methyltransferase
MRLGYDIIGDLAIFEIPEGSGIAPEEAVDEIRKTHPRIRTVLQRTGEREGEFRLRKTRKLYGKETETVHKEHGFRFKLDPTKVYFSPREATERERIASMVRPGETVMVMFAGVGPYGIVIAGKQPGVRKVYQVEINPEGVEYMSQNIAMNKLGHLVVPVQGDVREACRPYYGKCDRVLTPLPRESHRFLDVALSCLGRKGIIHFYAVGRHAKGLGKKESEEQLFSGPLQNLRDACGKVGRKARIMARKKVLPFSPGSWKVCIDAEIRS